MSKSKWEGQPWLELKGRKDREKVIEQPETKEVEAALENLPVDIQIYLAGLVTEYAYYGDSALFREGFEKLGIALDVI